MKADRPGVPKQSLAKASGPTQGSVLMLGVYLLTGMLLVLGQLLPGGTQQVASGESLPQAMLWLLVGALFATDRVLARFVLEQGRFRANRAESWKSLGDLGLVLLGGGLLVWVCVSTWNVYGRGNLRFAVNGCWQWFAWAAAIVVLSRMMFYSRIQQGLQWLMIALAWLVAMHGFYQIYVSLPADRARFRENPQAVLREAGIDAPVGSSTYLLFEQRLQDDSPTGPFALTNSLAGFLVPWILVLFAQAIQPDSRLGKRRVWWLVGVSVTACLCVCLLWTKSRTGWIALAVGTIAIGFGNPALFRNALLAWQGLWFGEVPEKPSELKGDDVDQIGHRLRRRVSPNLGGFPILIMLLIGLAATFTIVGLWWWDPKLWNEAGRSLAFRSEYWRTTLRMVADYPWLGVGPGNFQAYYSMYKPVLESETIADPHNFLLETLAVAGWPALLLLVAVMIGLTRSMAMRGLFGRQDRPSLVDREQGDAAPSRSRYEARGRGLRNALIALWVGAMTGALAVWLGSGALGNMPDYVPYAAAIPVAVAVLMFRFGLPERSSHAFEDAEYSPVGYGPALLGVGVHLMASGGWMTPGIGNTIAVLVAGIWASGNRKDAEAIQDSNESESRLAEFALRPGSAWSSVRWLFLSWILVVAFYLTAWLPRQRSQQVDADRMKAGQIDENLAIAMVIADPWNPVGYRWLSDVRLGQVQREAIDRGDGLGLSVEKFRETAKAYLASDRINWETWAQLGHWELVISPTAKESLNRALNYYREATHRAPGEGGLLVQAALAAWLSGDRSAQHEFLSRAEAIESNVTHVDRKLARAVIYWPAIVGPPSTRVAPAVWQAARDTKDLPMDWVRAEPVYRFLRSQLTHNPQ